MQFGRGIKCRLLRVLNKAPYWTLEAEFLIVNLQHVVCQFSTLPCSISLMWKLQTLVIVGANHLIVAPSEIWKMTQLRHLKCDYVRLPDPPGSDDKDDFVVLGNLQTLQTVMDFRMSEEACKRIPNIKKLLMKYGRNDNRLSDNLQNVGRLQRLESLNIWCYHEICISKLKYTLPTSLKKLVLSGKFACLEDFWTIIGSLPQLEVLKVTAKLGSQRKLSFVVGGFLRLKFLSIEDEYLESWIVERASYLPVVEKLVLIDLDELDEIPSRIREISTLQLISLVNCSECRDFSYENKATTEGFQNPFGPRGCCCIVNDIYP